MVALIGPDGSGKTTVAEGLVSRLGGSEFPRAHYFRRWLGILPRHRDVKARIGRRPHAEAHPVAIPLGRWRALLQPAYQSLELRLGARRIGRLRRAGDLVVFDRYAFDAFIQTANQAASPRALDLVCSIAPRPDLLLYLDDDPEAVHARKPELPVEEIRRQQQAARRCVERRRYGRIIDARGGVAATITAAAASVLAEGS